MWILFDSCWNGFLVGLYCIFIMIPVGFIGIIIFSIGAKMIEDSLSKIVNNLDITLHATDISFKIEEEKVDEKTKTCE